LTKESALTLRERIFLSTEAFWMLLMGVDLPESDGDDVLRRRSE
jgi:hypothetical protein